MFFRKNWLHILYYRLICRKVKRYQALSREDFAGLSNRLGKEEGMRKPAERYHRQAIEAAVADGKPLFKTGRKKWQEWNIAGPHGNGVQFFRLCFGVEGRMN